METIFNNIDEIFKTFQLAFEWAEKNSTPENQNILQIVKAPESHYYSVNNSGFAETNHTIICTFNSGRFFFNSAIQTQVQLWVNALNTSELSKLCFEKFGHGAWGNITDDQMAYLYLSQLVFFQDYR